jgi:phage terminase large subunit
VCGFIERVVCAREIQKSIKDSVKKLLEDQIALLGLGAYFTSLVDRILVNGKEGAEIIFFGFYRNVSQIKSLEACDLIWIEEAENLTKESWDIVDPTIRRLGSRAILTYNPQLLSDFVITRFQQNPPSNALVIKINYPDNPFCTPVTLDQAARMKIEDEASYLHVFRGECIGESDMVIISSAWIEAAVDAHIVLAEVWEEDIAEPSGDNRLGFDPCDQGDDFNATAIKHDYLVTALEEWRGKGTDLDMSTSEALEQARTAECNCFNYDVDGIGVGVTLALKDENTNGLTIGQFDAGGRVAKPDLKFHDSKKNKDTFYNIKAQRWWQLREKFMKTYIAVTTGRRYPMHELISLSSDISPKLLEKLKRELSSPRREKLAGKFIVESKRKLKKRGISSHNLADALVMADHDSSEVTREVRGIVV